MEPLRAAVKELIPGSLAFLVVGLAVGVALLFGSPRTARWGRRWLACLLCVYVLLSMQGTSDLLSLGLSHGYHRLSKADEAQNARVVVVLSNGILEHQTDDQELASVNLQSSFNALEGARLYRLLSDPLIVVSGGPSGPEGRVPESQVLAAALAQLGVPAAHIVLESQSRSTYEQALNVNAWLRANGHERFVLVTVPEHMRRAVGLFVARGLRPIPSVSGLQYGGPPYWWATSYALQGSESAIYEYLAWCYYRIRGWL